MVEIEINLNQIFVLTDKLFRRKLPKFLRKATKQQFIYDGNFHEAVGPGGFYFDFFAEFKLNFLFSIVLVVAQCFGLFPVQGILSKDISNLRFTWISLRMIYSILFIISIVTYCCIISIKVFQKPISFDVVGE